MQKANFISEDGKPYGLFYEVVSGAVIIGDCSQVSAYHNNRPAKIVIPAQIAGIPVSAIGDHAFQRSALEEISLPEGLRAIGASAFKNCSDLREIRLPDQIAAIEKECFSACETLREIALPDGVLRIGLGAFEVCGNLASIRIPASVLEIGEDAFYGCDSLREVHYGGSRLQWEVLLARTGAGNEVLFSAAVHYQSGEDF